MYLVVLFYLLRPIVFCVIEPCGGDDGIGKSTQRSERETPPKNALKNGTV